MTEERAAAVSGDTKLSGVIMCLLAESDFETMALLFSSPFLIPVIVKGDRVRERGVTWFEEVQNEKRSARETAQLRLLRTSGIAFFLFFFRCSFSSYFCH